MKKRTLTPLMVLAMLVLTLVGQAQTLTECLPNTVDANTTIILSIKSSSDAFMSSTGAIPGSVGSIWRTAGGSPTYSGSWTPTDARNGTLTLNVPPTAPGGSYSIQVPRWPSGTVTTSGLLTVVALPPPPMGQISGKVWSDDNGNGIQDAGEANLVGLFVRFLPGPYYASTNTLGQYSAWLPTGTYTVSTSPSSLLYSVTLPGSGTYSVNIPTAGSSVINRNFGWRPNPGPHDLRTQCYTSTPRPGFNCSISGSITNDYIAASTPTTHTVTFPTWLTVTGYSSPPISTAPGSATFAVPALSSAYTYPYNYFICNTVYTTVPVGTPFGTPVTVTSQLNSYVDDNPSNNFHSSTRPVQGSYDPNDKAVFKASGASAEGYVFPEDSVLTYRIRFQNTGTDTAFTVRIRDTLDTDLNPLSFKILSASHPFVHTLSKTGHLEFVFNHILLPDSHVNEPASHGWLLYEIRRKPGVPMGTVMTNACGIYFDFNVPVQTNTTSSILCAHHTAGYTETTPSSLTYDFTSTGAGALSYHWDFGDGTTSTVANPSHTWSAPGVYNVCLISANTCEADTLCKTINVSCATAVSSFTHSGLLSHSFISTSTGGISSWSWAFGDGGTSTVANPTHTYAAPGTYNVCLITSNGCHNDTLCSSITVTCIPASASFTHLTGSTGSVSFDNTTSGTGTSYWTFGDGGTSTTTDPVHVYAAPGTYNVCLITTELCGSDTTCSTVNVCAWPVPAFSSASSGLLTHSFTDLTTGGTPTSWSWSFGDGGTSSSASPTHTYAAPGTYNVCLITSNSCGLDTICNSVTVVCATAVSSFTHSGLLSHSFTSTSTGSISSWSWAFGDGGTSTVANPTHTYAAPGTYNVCLITSNGCDTDTLCDNVVVTCIPASASFTHLTGSTGSVSFDNTTSGTFTSYWTFGDGGTSTATDPVHVYAAPGTYNVCLITTELCGNDTTCNTVNVCAWPVPAFSSASSGLLTQSFTDLTTGGTPTSWSWSFGDGGTSSSASPTHTYAAPGTYNVCLITSNSCGLDTICSSVTVVCDVATSSFTHSGLLTHSFTSTSTGSISSWSWTFGDGGTSTVANPTHTYAGPGTYTVCLIASNGCDTDTLCSTVTITCTPVAASFSTSNLGTGTWFFDNTTAGSTTSFWDFGDGSTSILTDPFHTYAAPGTYTACLISTDTCGSDTTCQTFTICAWPTSNFGVVTSGLVGTFNDLSTGGASSWAWDFGDGGTSTVPNPAHMFPGPGTYTVCLQASNACGVDEFCVDVTVTCTSVPMAGYTWTDMGMGNVNFSNSSTGLPTLSSSWDFGDGGTSTASSPTHTYASSGTYLACLTVTDPCGTSTKCDSVTVIVTSSGSQVPQGVTLQVHPNPTQGGITLSGEWPSLHGPLTLELVDATGRVVALVQGSALNGQILLEADLSAMAAGLYQARLLTPLGNATLRVIRQ